MIKVKILIVDDEVDFCMIMQSYFEDRNCDVYMGFSLTEGLKLLEKVNPDILFLDNNLPDGEGWSKINEIVSAYPNLKVNLISAYGERPEMIGNSENIRFWEKPISTTQLDEIL